MGNSLFYVDHKLHDPKCNGPYNLARLYIRKSTKPKTEMNDSTGKEHHYGQRFLPKFWLCEGCNLIVEGPFCCPKCESEDLAPGNKSKYGYDSDHDFYHCNKCKKVFKAKFKKASYNRILVIL